MDRTEGPNISIYWDWDNDGRPLTVVHPGFLPDRVDSSQFLITETLWPSIPKLEA